MGQQGYQGSVLCLTETGPNTNVYEPSTYFKQRIAEANAPN